ncbi:helix-turn-helix transcriptional regulator [Myceligenerans salitolerans]|uniref:Helix-turn-helix transcriptional regulator n=2 Tax=Myceligenerans salitolerans TaxID=1230528 RepID=A0ABS3ICD6_9MICO|nr:helix-turn-helix transcriptional regulator [Myceligenerans salitolerans]
MTAEATAQEKARTTTRASRTAPARAPSGTQEPAAPEGPGASAGLPVREPVRRAAEACPVEVAIAVVGGSWKMTVVKHLLGGPLRFNALNRAVGPVTPRVLTRQLRDLEADGVVHREVFPEVPPRVEYSLTPLGESLAGLVAQLDTWGGAYANRLGLVR